MFLWIGISIGVLLLFCFFLLFGRSVGVLFDERGFFPTVSQPIIVIVFFASTTGVQMILPIFIVVDIFLPRNSLMLSRFLILNEAINNIIL